AAAGADVGVDQAPLPGDGAEDGQAVEVQTNAQVDGRGGTRPPLPLEVAADRQAVERTADRDPAAARGDQEVAIDNEVVEITPDVELAAGLKIHGADDRQRAAQV